MADGLVGQTLTAKAEGTTPAYRQNRRGELVLADMLDELIQDGYGHFVSNAARQTALATGGTSFSDTAPAFIIDIPAGSTMIPLEVVLNQGGTVAGGVITCIISVDNKARYSSGGTALTVRNYRLDEPLASGAAAWSTSPTAAAVGKEMSLFSDILVQGVSNTVSSILPTNVNWQGKLFMPTFCVGPASLVIYTFAATTQPSWFFKIGWLEVPSASVV